MIYAKELFSCFLGMDDFGDEDEEEDIGEEDKVIISVWYGGKV
jgi:hypothetical protein